MCKVIETNTHLNQKITGPDSARFTWVSPTSQSPSPGATLQCLPGRARLSPLGCGCFFPTKRPTKRGGFWLVFWLVFLWAFFAKATENHHQKLAPNKKVAVWLLEMGISTKTNLGW